MEQKREVSRGFDVLFFGTGLSGWVDPEDGAWWNYGQSHTTHTHRKGSISGADKVRGRQEEERRRRRGRRWQGSVWATRV